MNGIQIETQEVGSGMWFPIVEYQPASDWQQVRAVEMMNTLKMLGLYARITVNGQNPEPHS